MTPARWRVRDGTPSRPGEGSRRSKRSTRISSRRVAATTSKSGSRTSTTGTASASTGRMGRSGIPIRSEGAAPDRIRFADTGANSDFESTWRSSPNTDLHYAFYGQDRWTANRLSITAGVRIDYQKVGYQDSTRVPEITDLLPDGTRIFPADLDGRRRDARHQHRCRAAPRRVVRRDRSGAHRVESVLRPLLQQPR